MADEKTQYGRGRLAAVFSIIVLTLLDSFFTIHLVQNGATELNPVLSYYLGHSHLVFFAVKYFLTTATIFLILASENIFGKKKVRLPANLLLAFYGCVLALVVYWEAYLAFFH
ncbi:MAG: hypothetical protein DRH15_00290 [Deltaproteobacteria bacterium]|nr:MAG: hypothetical protein DRH15_00290 [Deltaproteobacteria bacterium]